MQVGKTIKELQDLLPKAWLRVLEEIRELLEFLPADGGKKFYTLWKQLPSRSQRNQERLALE